MSHRYCSVIAVIIEDTVIKKVTKFKAVNVI